MWCEISIISLIHILTMAIWKTSSKNTILYKFVSFNYYILGMSAFEFESK